MFNRRQDFLHLGRETCFLWGARQTGKSTLLRARFPRAPYYDLLHSDVFRRLQTRPSILREELLARHPKDQPVIIDEIQKVPALLDEVQALAVQEKIRFILCGSSARKLKRGGGNLLGGRALRYELHPLVFPEIPDFDLERALNHGLLPRHYLAADARPRLESYIGDYLKEEIAAEALARNIPAFSRFLEAAAFSNGEQVNFQNAAAECGVSGPTVKEYFQILEDTLLGRMLPAFSKRPKRRLISSPRFYYFDVGLANVLLKRGRIEQGGEAFGRAFEHFIFQELLAHRHYSGLGYDFSYWRTSGGIEVDFILGGQEVAVEVKSTESAESRHMKGLRAFQEDHGPRRSILVSRDPRPRRVDGVDVLPWRVFLEDLWAGRILR